MRIASSKDPMARSSSLNSIQVGPRSPITSRSHHTADRMENDAEEGLEMNLLGDEERRQAARGLDGYGDDFHDDSKHPMSAKDKRAMVLLCVLCESYWLLRAVRWR